MAFRAGTTTFFQLDAETGSLVNISSYMDSVSHTQSTETKEVTAFGSASKVYIAGLNDGDTISFSGPLDSPIGTQLYKMKAAQTAGTASFSWVYGPAGSVAAYPKVTGESLLSSFTFSSSVGGRVEYSASLQISGAVTNAVW